MGNFITARGFTTDIGFLDNIPISNVLYAYDTENVDTIILEANN